MTRFDPRSATLRIARDDAQVFAIRGELRSERPIERNNFADLITAVRRGEHVELEVRARVFRQKDGVPNRNFLRFEESILPELAASFVGKPVLFDHRDSDQRARIGTIVASELAHESGGWAVIVQTLRVVKPEAVISVLDGTLDRFSIGWYTPSLQDLVCSVHRTEVLTACRCLPGDRIDVDGQQVLIELEWLSAEGKEVSAVNAPAVSGTRIEEVRAALAAQLAATSGCEVADVESPLPSALSRVAERLGLDPGEIAAHAERINPDYWEEGASVTVSDQQLAALAGVAKQLGLDPDELAAHAAALGLPPFDVHVPARRADYGVFESTADQLGLDRAEFAAYLVDELDYDPNDLLP